MTTKDNALRMAIEALEYHTEQTRPIQKTIDTLDVCKAALSDAVMLPDGWVAVPVEPTKNMLLQICANGEDFRDWNNKYKAMLQAAPTCEKEKG